MTQIATQPERQPNRTAIWLSSAVFLGALIWYGHRLVFGQFQDYDDEGYLLLTVQQFLQGLPLYDQVYTQYGPAYYLWQQVLHTLIGIPVTHDATRIVTIGVWLSCAVLVGAIVWLLTRRQLLTVLGTVAAFMHLTQLTYEPGHPQELCILGVLAAMALTTWRLVEKARIGTAASIGVWAFVAVTALTKVNVGAFLAAALTLGLVTSLTPSPWRRVVERIVMVATMAAVPALMRGDLIRSDVAAYVVVVWCGVLAVVISRSRDVAEEGLVTVRDLVVGVASVAIGCALIVAGILYEGTSLKALFEGLFVAPLLLPKVFWRPLPVPGLLAVAAPAALLAAWCWHRGWIRQRWVDVAALAWAVIMFALSVGKVYWVLFAVGPLLVWLVLSDRAIAPEQRAARRILAFAAIFMGLQAYPMPGTQIVLGTVLYVPLALVMIASAQRSLGAQERSREAAPPSFRRRALLATVSVAAVVNLGTQAQGFYARSIPLDLPGARLVRTTERNVATYRWLTANLRENCDAFLSGPGLNSLHFWTEMAPVSTLNTTVWALMFDDDQQRRVVAAAERVERLCVAWSPPKMDAPPPEIAARPLMVWLQREFEPRARFGEWEFRMRRNAPAVTVYEGRWVQGADVVLTLPSIDREAVARIAVVDVDEDRTLVDSVRSGEVVVLDEEGARLGVDLGIDVSRPRRITLRPAAPAASSSTGHSVVVRLWARDGRSLAIVPVVSAPVPAASPHGSSTQAGPS